MISFADCDRICKNSNFNALNLSFKNVIIIIRLECCGMEDLTIMAHGMPEDKKDNVWLGRGKCCGL